MKSNAAIYHRMAMLGYCMFQIDTRQRYFVGSAIRPFELFKALSKLIGRFDYIHGRFQRYMRIPKLVFRALQYRHYPFRLVFIEGLTTRFSFIDVLVLRFLNGLGWKILIDVHDIPTDQTYFLTMASDLSNQALPLTNLQSPNSTILDFVGHEFERNYAQSKIIVLTNGTNPERFPESPVPKAPNVFYVGGFSHQLGTSLLLSAMCKVRETVPEARLILVGNPVPSYEDEFKRIVAEMPFVRVYRSVNYFKLPEIIKDARVCVIPYSKNIYLNHATPIKLFDYLAAGRPIIATQAKAIKHIVEDAECGILTEFNSDAFSQALVSILTDDDLAGQMGINARQAAIAKHSWNIRAQQLLEQIWTQIFGET